MILCSDVIIHICEFISTREMLSLTLTCRDFHSIILFDEKTMKNHTFTVRKKVDNLKFLEKISFRVLNLRLQYNPISDNDFSFIRGIHTLNMSHCNQTTITDEAFVHLKGIHTLDISHCNQTTITDKAFENLKGIHTLNMSHCYQKTITDKAFDNLKGIHTLDISGCDQETITDRAFMHLEGIHTLGMLGCNQETISDKSFIHLEGINRIKMNTTRFNRIKINPKIQISTI